MKQSGVLLCCNEMNLGLWLVQSSGSPPAVQAHGQAGRALGRSPHLPAGGSLA